MALSQSPRKVPLPPDDDAPPRLKTRSTGSNVTKRVFLCGVVVEGADTGRELAQDVQDLVASLGDPMDMESEPLSPSSSQQQANLSSIGARVPVVTNRNALNEVVKELVNTERTYVKRLRILKTDYADPLRSFARSKETAIIAAYEAKTLFGNVDQLLPVNEAFLTDLEKMERMAHKGGPGVGDVALKHFKKLKGFEHYRQYYAKREEAQRIFEHEIKKSSRFAEYIDRVKYSTADARNKVGLRELLMEPVQRIPRYTLLFRTMLKHMSATDPQRAPLLEADEIASRIALAETDDQTKRAATLYSLAGAIEDFPVALVSNSRHFITCIDVQDVIAPDPFMPMSSSGPAAAIILHCTLFLFDDKLVIVKRPAEKSGRALAGVDDAEKVAKPGRNTKKTSLVCKGVIDITDVVVSDVGGADFHIYLENPPMDVSERWAGRQFRSLSVVFPPSPVHLDPQRTESEKQCFLEQLWAAQARFRTRAGRSVILQGKEREVENRGGRITRAQTYFNVYTRTSFLQEPKKTKIVMHVDPEGVADAIPFGSHSPPYVVVRVQPMAGELSRYTVTSSSPDDEPEEDIMQTSRIPERIVQTIHQYGLFKFSTGNVSRPTTPTASRSRAAIFGLDVISRNLFGARPGSSMGDFFGGSMNGHRRARTADSRNSTLTGTTSTSGSSIGRFSRTSVTTAATSIGDDEPSYTGSFSKSTSGRARSLSRGAKKLVKRAKSPFSADPTSEPESPARPKDKGKGSYSRRRSMSTGQVDVFETDGYSDWDGGEPEDALRLRLRRIATMDESERDLAMRLELARRNSKNQHGKELPHVAMEEPSEETIYEDEPPPSLRPLSRASRLSRSLPEVPQDVASLRSGTPTLRAPSPLPSRPSSPDERNGRPLSRNSSDRSDRRPLGPRSPSPLLPRSPAMLPTSLSSVEANLETTLVDVLPTTPSRPLPPTTTTPIPRSKRQPFEPIRAANREATPRAAEAVEEPKKPQSSVQPLSVKKKSSVRSNASTVLAVSPSAARRNSGTRRVSPMGKNVFANSSPRRVSGQRANKLPSLLETLDASENMDAADVDRLIRVAETTKTDIESSRRALKRIRLQTDRIMFASPVRNAVAEWEARPVSPVKTLRTPQRATPPPAAPSAVTKEAQARREEMMQAIGRRSGGTPRARPTTMLETSSSLSSISSGDGAGSSAQTQEIARKIEEEVREAEENLVRALQNQEQVSAGMKTLLAQLQEVETRRHLSSRATMLTGGTSQKTSQLTAVKAELQSSQRQREVVKDLLDDKHIEVEVLYEVSPARAPESLRADGDQSFNEELESMYNDAGLPEDEAWAAMTRDLKAAKRSEKAAHHENYQLKRRIEELEMQQEHMYDITRRVQRMRCQPQWIFLGADGEQGHCCMVISIAFESVKKGFKMST
ncbi:hypothetical protein BN946_scf184568.g1 [Trametes cinnabarina]|uniref:DH domain-containing protein n=1 Tax=Pycnoporus cinnabarinus TaxID=5643 RepID=A0A060S6D8_PYCCI|nr:hypothetical protein BN946_scf184568.g1 [Trametes cinnabarina]